MRNSRQNLENIQKDSKSNFNSIGFEFYFEDSNFALNLEYALKGSAEKAAAYKFLRYFPMIARCFFFFIISGLFSDG